MQTRGKRTRTKDTDAMVEDGSKMVEAGFASMRKKIKLSVADQFANLGEKLYDDGILSKDVKSMLKELTEKGKDGYREYLSKCYKLLHDEVLRLKEKADLKEECCLCRETDISYIDPTSKKFILLSSLPESMQPAARTYNQCKCKNMYLCTTCFGSQMIIVTSQTFIGAMIKCPQCPGEAFFQLRTVRGINIGDPRIINGITAKNELKNILPLTLWEPMNPVASPTPTRPMIPSLHVYDSRPEAIRELDDVVNQAIAQSNESPIRRSNPNPLMINETPSYTPIDSEDEEEEENVISVG